MQDPYSAMMGNQQRTDPYKSFQLNRGASGSALPPTSTASASAYYHGLGYGANTYGSPDNYQSMTMPSGLSQEYSPLPAHMGSHNPMNSSNGLSRINPTTHTITHTATPPHASSGVRMSDMSSPVPSSSRLSMSPEGHSQGHQGQSSPGDSIIKHESSGSDNSSIKSGNNDEDSQSGMPPKKRSLSLPEENRDETYWDKRKKNNESAKRSRESRRMKEEQIALRVVYLEQENLQLRTEVSLLKSEIEKLRCMLYNS